MRLALKGGTEQEPCTKLMESTLPHDLCTSISWALVSRNGGLSRHRDEGRKKSMNTSGRKDRNKHFTYGHGTPRSYLFLGPLYSVTLRSLWIHLNGIKLVSRSSWNSHSNKMKCIICQALVFACLWADPFRSGSSAQCWGLSYRFCYWGES